jgi:hypothetical protein
VRVPVLLFEFLGFTILFQLKKHCPSDLSSTCDFAGRIYFQSLTSKGQTHDKETCNSVLEGPELSMQLDLRLF